MIDDFGNSIHAGRRASDEDWAEMRERVDEIERTLGGTVEATRQIKADTSELVEAFRNMQGFFRVLDYVGRLAKPLGWILALAAAALIFWGQFKAALAALFRG